MKGWSLMRIRLERRYGWIEACLRWAGCFGVAEKAAYREVFGLTDSMVSRDQDSYRRLLNEGFSGQPVLHKRGRLEVAGDAPLPYRFSLPEVTRWLAEVLGSKFEHVPPIHRADPQPEVIQALVQALSSKRPIRFSYQPRQGEEARRFVSPHVIVHVVGRLHLRGWDHERNSPRDFVLTRMSDVSLADDKAAFIGQEHDAEWSEHVRLDVVPREAKNVDALRWDFKLDGYREDPPKVRKAYMRYLIDGDAPESIDAFRSPVIVRLRKS